MKMPDKYHRTEHGICNISITKDEWHWTIKDAPIWYMSRVMSPDDWNDDILHHINFAAIDRMDILRMLRAGVILPEQIIFDAQ